MEKGKGKVFFGVGGRGLKHNCKLFQPESDNFHFEVGSIKMLNLALSFFLVHKIQSFTVLFREDL